MTLNPKLKKYLERDWDRLYKLGAWKLRDVYAQMMKEGKVRPTEEVGSIENIIVKTTIRDTPIRIYNPKVKSSDGVFIWMHGGGFVLGDIEHGDATCRAVTNKLGCKVISIDYGLCPPHKFPDPEIECYEVVKWVYRNAEKLNISCNKICVAGDSVGGSLAAVLSLMARDREESLIACQVLVYPCLDWNDMGERPSRRDNGKGYRLTSYGVEWFNHHHLRDRVVDGLNPYVSPLLAINFKNLPPTVIITSEFDLLRDESIDYAKILSENGVEVCLKNYPGIIHGFLAMEQLGITEGLDAINLICKKVGEIFSKI